MNAGIRLAALIGYGQSSDVEAAARAGLEALFVKSVVMASLLDALTSA
jgi:hypothetical protein